MINLVDLEFWFLILLTGVVDMAWAVGLSPYFSIHKNGDDNERGYAFFQMDPPSPAIQTAAQPTGPAPTNGVSACATDTQCMNGGKW